MGRRKIEIQPITHERNRSVTFLKRKNGLFKKAYELGVLCSVDVAVIIFEERPGHHVKLYQYCSGDANSMVQRHLHFDGERDTKGPADFSGNKGEEAADEDEDGDDEDGGSKHKTKSKEHPAAIKPKSEQSSNGTIPIRPAHNPAQDFTSRNAEIDFRSRMATGTSLAGVPILPVSNERQSSMNISRPPSMNQSSNGISMPLPIPVPNMLPQKRPRHDNPVVPPPGISYPYRLDVDLSTFPPAAHATSLQSQQQQQQHHQQQQYAQRQQQQSLNLPFPQSLGLSLGTDSLGQQQQSPFEFPSSRRQLGSLSSTPSYQGGGGGGGGGVNNGLGGVFGRGTGPQTANMLMDLLSTSASNDNSSFEWPGTTSSPQSLDAALASNDNTSWLEFLSAATSQQSPHSSSLPLGLPTPTSRPASNSVSSTSSMTGRMPYGLPSASSSSECLSPSRKRSRDGSMGCDDYDPGSGHLKAMRIGEDGSRRSVG